jgi:hypothetical protein
MADLLSGAAHVASATIPDRLILRHRLYTGSWG